MSQPLSCSKSDSAPKATEKVFVECGSVIKECSDVTDTDHAATDSAGESENTSHSLGGSASLLTCVVYRQSEGSEPANQ